MPQPVRIGASAAGPVPLNRGSVLSRERGLISSAGWTMHLTLAFCSTRVCGVGLTKNWRIWQAAKRGCWDDKGLWMARWGRRAFISHGRGHAPGMAEPGQGFTQAPATILEGAPSPAPAAGAAPVQRPDFPPLFIAVGPAIFRSRGQTARARVRRGTHRSRPPRAFRRSRCLDGGF